mmetsp:Transcript_28279/g.34946  ORF Transcript_28279/g.34946 Transcript_28279/m.34946 type:complete len:94 (-) Transcript_28279:83-364(-)
MIITSPYLDAASRHFSATSPILSMSSWSSQLISEYDCRLQVSTKVDGQIVSSQSKMITFVQAYIGDGGNIVYSNMMQGNDEKYELYETKCESC